MTETEWKSSFTVVYMGLPFYRVLSISDDGHFRKTEYYYVLYSIAQKNLLLTLSHKNIFQNSERF